MAVQVERVAHDLLARRPVRWLFVTLTVRNCSSADLGGALDALLSGAARLSRQAWWRRWVVGWFRTVEVTRNLADGSWHPHMHVLVAVKPSYFVAGYRRQSLWVEDWRRALRVEYDPSVRVRALGDVRSSIAEVSKYVTKPGLVGEGVGSSSALERETVGVLLSVLRGRRLFGFGGEMAAVYRELRAAGVAGDVESDAADLVRVEGAPSSCRCSVCSSEMGQRVYRWMGGSLGYRASD